MKKNKLCIISGIFITFLLVSICFSMYIQKWYIGNQHTIEWGAITAFSNGDTFPKNYVIEYEIFLVDFETDPGKTKPIKIGNTQKTNFIIKLNKPGKFLIGLKTVCKNQDGYVLAESGIGWTDGVKSVDSELTFGLHCFMSKLP